MDNDDDVNYSLLYITDAPKMAYAAVVYVEKEVNDVLNCNLFFVKARLAPVKEISNPRLELMAALIEVLDL